MKLDGYRYLVERNKLLIWLEEERHKLAELSPEERSKRGRELEREFDQRMADLYQEGKMIFASGKESRG